MQKVRKAAEGSLCLAFILSILTFPTFSETLGNSPQCDNSTLHTTTGPATLNARWTANTIILNWNAGNDATFTAPAQNDAAYSCEYDGGITLPTAPTRSGYTFGGWRVAQSQCSLSDYWNNTIASEMPNSDAIHHRWKPISYPNGYTMTDSYGEDNSSDLNPGEWAMLFSSGELKGRAICSNIIPSNYNTIIEGVNNGTITLEQALESIWGVNGSGRVPYNTFASDSSGQYCWCASTNFNNQCPVLAPDWLFGNDLESATNCANSCADACIDLVTYGYRRAYFNVTQ